MVNECAKEFFDEYYCSYNIDCKRYVFENGVSVIITQDGSRAYMNDADIIEAAALVNGSIREDDNFSYDIGSIVFELNYIGNGRFSVKPYRYNEIINIMDSNAG